MSSFKAYRLVGDFPHEYEMEVVDVLDDNYDHKPGDTLTVWLCKGSVGREFVSSPERYKRTEKEVWEAYLAELNKAIDQIEEALKALMTEQCEARFARLKTYAMLRSFEEIKG